MAMHCYSRDVRSSCVDAPQRSHYTSDTFPALVLRNEVSARTVWPLILLLLSVLCTAHAKATEITGSDMPSDIRGLAHSVLTTPQAVRILVVHGIGCRHANWSDALQRKIASNLGFAEIEYASASPQDAYRSRQVITYYPDGPRVQHEHNAITAAFVDRCRDLSHGRSVAIQPYPTLVVRSYQHAESGKFLQFYEVTWSPLAEELKFPRLRYDGQADATRNRAWLNSAMKRHFNDKLSDAVFYLGAGRRAVETVMLEALCRMWRADATISLESQSSCVFDPTGSGIDTNRYAVIAESLGSQITFDALRSEKIQPLVDTALSYTDSVFLLANQLPLLELGQQVPSIEDLKRFSGNLLADKYRNWASSCQTGDANQPRDSESLMAALKADRSHTRERRAKGIYLAPAEAELTLALRAERESDIALGVRRESALLASRELSESSRKHANLALSIEALNERLKLSNLALRTAESRQTRAVAIRDSYLEQLRTARRNVSQDQLLLSGDSRSLLSDMFAHASEAIRQATELVTTCTSIKLFKAERGSHNESVRASQLGRCRARMARASERITLIESLAKYVKSSDPADEIYAREFLQTTTKFRASATEFRRSVSATDYRTFIGASTDSPALYFADTGFRSAMDRADVAITSAETRLRAHFDIPVALSTPQGLERAIALRHNDVGRLEKALIAAEQETLALRGRVNLARAKFERDGTELSSARSVMTSTAQQVKELESKARNSMELQAAAEMASENAKQRSVRARSDVESPRREGWAAFYALLQQSDESMMVEQAGELAGQTSNVASIECRGVIANAIQLLREQSSQSALPQFVAFSDPNDLLSYEVSPDFQSRYKGIQFRNSRVKLSQSFMNLYADPIRAHSSYLTNDTVARIIATGRQVEFRPTSTRKEAP